METILNGKKILLLAPSFYNYYTSILKELECRGAEVHLILEVHDPLYLYFFRKEKFIREQYTYKYYSSRINNIQDVDYIFLIRGEAITTSIMELLIKKFPNATKIMYQWDSFANNPNIKNIIHYFDKCFTFDPQDAQKYNWIYRPLFYLNSHANTKSHNKIYDFVFIGTLYYKRAKLLVNLKDFCKRNNYKLFHFLYVKKFEYFIHTKILRDSRYTILSLEDVNFVSLTNTEVENIYLNSKIFVDYTAENQVGLTIRTIESIGNHSKIITNNKDIINADFYNPNNIYIYNIDNFQIPSDFINSPYKELDASLYKKYSLKGWIDDIFCGE